MGNRPLEDVGEGVKLWVVVGGCERGCEAVGEKKKRTFTPTPTPTHPQKTLSIGFWRHRPKILIDRQFYRKVLNVEELNVRLRQALV